MTDKMQIWLPDAKKSHSCGVSLSRSLYRRPTTILCLGPLGAGKTTFVQGLAEGLGIKEAVTSPTFALEQRYASPKGPLLHLDLYRLSQRDALERIHATADHEGIRCIEWADRLPPDSIDEPSITLDFREERDGRMLTAAFDDMKLPAPRMIDRWREEVHLPANVAAHCDAVAAFGVKICDALQKGGILCRTEAVRAAGLVHDLFRFIDFRPGAGPQGTEALGENPGWKPWKERWKGLRHEGACASFLVEQEYPELAEIVAVHGLMLPAPDRTMIEQQILFYADKRVCGDRVVTLNERFDDFRKRYSKGKQSEQSKVWFSEALKIEEDLFPDGAPTP